MFWINANPIILYGKVSVIAIFMPRASVAGTERLDSIPLEQIRPI
jgi:hypothetical protein